MFSANDGSTSTALLPQGHACLLPQELLFFRAVEHTLDFGSCLTQSQHHPSHLPCPFMQKQTQASTSTRLQNHCSERHNPQETEKFQLFVNMDITRI